MHIPQPEKPEWAEGKACHRLLQDHVSGKVTMAELNHIEYKFPIVEEVDFDERCRFEFIIEGYKIIGFYDGINWKEGRWLEGKFSSSPWSIKKFKDSYQRMLYAFSDARLKEAILVTGSRNPEDWKLEPLKVYPVPVTEKDKRLASDWILDGIKILESGNFTSDLVDGKCMDRWCYWGDNCQFK